MNEARRGRFGELLLIEGERMAMRYWDRARAGLRYGPVENEFEFCGFVLEGRARWTVSGESFEVSKGTSWTIPAHTPHSLEVIEELTAVECVTRTIENA